MYNNLDKMKLHRTLALPLHRAVQRATLVLLQGPRGSGKSTLLRREFPGHTFVSLEDARDRAHARTQPDRFLASLRGAAIVDDAHRAPELVEYLRGSAAPNPVVISSARRASALASSSSTPRAVTPGRSGKLAITSPS